MLNNILKLAKQEGYTVRRIEELAGIGVNTITRWDKVSPSVEKVKRVADVLGCTVDDLIKEHADPEPQYFRSVAQ